MSTQGLRTHDYFGVRVAGGTLDSWLYCQVSKVDCGIIHGHVINGNWYFYFNPADGTARYAEYYDKSLLTGWELAYTGPFPKGLRGYNEAIEFMVKEVTRPYVVRKWRALRQRVWWSGGFFSRLRIATTAFKQAWVTGVPYQAPKDDWDDDIAF